MTTPGAWVGEIAPDFALLDQQGVTHRLSQYRGSYVVLYFYPKDMTPGCTTEACDFRDNLARATSVGAVVLGISADSVKRHAKFAEQEQLNFPLLADETKDVLRSYGVWQQKSMMGKRYMGIARTTFLIDPHGYVRKVYENVKVAGHVNEVLKDLGAMATA